MSYQPKDPWFLPFIQRIRKRPGMFLGDETVRTLARFITGYTSGREHLGVPAFGNGEEDILVEFDRWIVKQLKSTKNIGWEGHIQEIDSSNKNIYTFFKLFDEYLSERGIVLSPDLALQWPPEVKEKK